MVSNRALHDGRLDPAVNNPLSEVEESPWRQYFWDKDLRACIEQDVERTFEETTGRGEEKGRSGIVRFPELEYFQSKTVRQMMVDVLFVYGRCNPTVAYKQAQIFLLQFHAAFQNISNRICESWHAFLYGTLVTKPEKTGGGAARMTQSTSKTQSASKTSRTQKSSGRVEPAPTKTPTTPTLPMPEGGAGVRRVVAAATAAVAMGLVGGAALGAWLIWTTFPERRAHHGAHRSVAANWIHCYFDAHPHLFSGSLATFDRCSVDFMLFSSLIVNGVFSEFSN